MHGSSSPRQTPRSRAGVERSAGFSPLHRPELPARLGLVRGRRQVRAVKRAEARAPGRSRSGAKPLPHRLGEAIRGLVALCLLLVPAIQLSAAQVDEAKLPPPATNKVDFLRDIKPILDASCLKCHGPEKPKSGFRIDTKAGLLKGGENGIDVIVGQSAKSPLIHFVSGQVPDMEMPPHGKGDPLTPAQVGQLRAWIDQGLVWTAGEESPRLLDFAATGGWLHVSGDERKFRELYWMREGWNGGAESFLLQDRVGSDQTLTVSGHALRDDYKVTLDLRRSDRLFFRAGYQQYRKYFDDSGGYLPVPATAVTRLGEDLHLDLGEAWVEAGGTLPFGLQLVGGYEYHFREGDKSTLQWIPTITGAGSKAILPNSKSVDEQRQVLRLDAAYDWRQLRLSDSFRYEFYNLETRRPFVVAGFPLVTADQRMLENSANQNLANAFRSEIQPLSWLFLSAGYLFTHTDGEDAFRQTLSDPSGGTPAGQLWNGRGITLDQTAHVFNGNVQLGLWEEMTFSAGVQTEWNRQHSFGEVNLDETDSLYPSIVIQNTNSVRGDYDRFTAEEKFLLRNTQLPFTVLFGEIRFRQEQIQQIEELAPAGAGFGTVNDFLRDTDALYDWRQYRVGFNVSPWNRLALNAYAQRRDRETTFHDNRDERPLGNPGLGYPAFIRERQTTADELGTRLVLRPASWLKTTLGFRVLTTDYETVTDATPAILGPISTPGGRVEAGEYDAHIYSLNLTLTPWRRLYFFSTFAFQDSRSVAYDQGSTAIAPFRGHVYSSINSANYALSENTDLRLTYDFSYANYGQDNAPDGLPLGIDYRQHGIRAGLGRRFLKRFLASLEYVWSYYNEPSSGHYDDFTAHGFFATVNVRWQ